MKPLIKQVLIVAVLGVTCKAAATDPQTEPTTKEADLNVHVLHLLQGQLPLQQFIGAMQAHAQQTGAEYQTEDLSELYQLYGVYTNFSQLCNIKRLEVLRDLSARHEIGLQRIQKFLSTLR